MLKAPAASTCRLCGASLERVFCDLGKSPLANSYLRPEDRDAMEPFFPLRALLCDRCLLVQLDEVATPEAVFSDYAYFSSYSSSWLDHSRRLADGLVDRFGLRPEHLVVELASNDGYLLQYVADRGVRVLGIEPAANVAEVARERGVPTRVEFFGEQTARALRAQAPADVLLGLNVLAHVPDLNDFVAGMAVALADQGVAVIEFPHLLHLIEQLQFDTIYHEHFSYFSFLTARRVLDRHGLDVFDVEELPSHGGSLRLFVHHSATGGHERSPRVDELAGREEEAGMDSIDGHAGFAERVERDKRAILTFLIGLREQGLRVAAYGAPAKGNTMLNYCGIGPELVEFTVDRNPHKQGRYLPGSEIPIHAPEALAEARPDVVLILPWNLAGEIVEQLAYVREWGGRFAARTPEMALLP
jgi:SAM-dependent methyltransferase